jgi:hypothetical protein
MKYKLLIAAVVVAGLVYLLFSTFFVDVQINKYTDIAAVKDQQAIEKGWIPAILPKSAYEITETHDLDKNTLFGSFKYKEQDEKAFLTYLFPLNDEKKTLYWEDFLFRVNKEKNIVKFRNRPLTQ